jgi:heptosyltransferase-1
MHAAVDRTIPVAMRRWRQSLLDAGTWREVRAAKMQVRAHRYTAILDCQGLIKSAWLARWARGPRWGFDRRSAREPLAALLYTDCVAVSTDRHAVARNRALGAAACGTDDGSAPSFSLAPAPLADRTLLDATATPFAVLLTNASRPSKRWPDENWREVARELQARRLGSLLFAGSAQEIAETQTRARGMRDAWVAPRSGLDTVAAVLARAAIVIGLDTGLSHLAAAVGAPTIGIFCDYEPRLVGITGMAPCASLGGVATTPTVCEVLAAVDDVLSCAGAPGRR